MKHIPQVVPYIRVVGINNYLAFIKSNYLFSGLEMLSDQNN